VTTRAPIFTDKDQGLAAIAYQGFLFSYTFLSITFDSPPLGSGVSDMFNAVNGGPGSLGRGTGHWVAAIPSIPQPATLSLIGLGLAALAWALHRRA
jgi:hypothetical protein